MYLDILVVLDIFLEVEVGVAHGQRRIRNSSRFITTLATAVQAASSATSAPLSAGPIGWVAILAAIPASPR